MKTFKEILDENVYSFKDKSIPNGVYCNGCDWLDEQTCQLNFGKMENHSGNITKATNCLQKYGR